MILIGTLVHIPHSDFTTALRNIAAALKDNGLMLITVKEGTGVRESADGRIFSLFQDRDLKAIFASLDFQLLDFSRNASKTGSGEIWLRYLLQKNEPAGSLAHYSSFPGVWRFEVANRDLKNNDVLSLFKIGKQSLYIKI